MKTSVLIIVLTGLLLSYPKMGIAQSVKEERISIGVLLSEQKLPKEAQTMLETRLRQALSTNGIADLNYAERFVLTAKVNTISKDIIPTTPARISYKLDVCIMVGDIIENKIYETFNVQISGIGINESKAYIKAFERIKGNSNDIQNMLSNAKIEIANFYTNNCYDIIEKSRMLANMQQYDEAISQLIAIPNICNECYVQGLKEAEIIYKQKIEVESHSYLEHARNEWAKSPNKQSAINAIAYIEQIDINSSAYRQIKLLRDEITQKLKEDEKKEWELKIKKYEEECTLRMKKQENNHALWLSIVDACKSIGTAWFSNRSQSVTNIIQGW